MRRRADSWFSVLLAGILAVHSVWVPAARGGDILQTVFHTRRPPPGADPAIETLAEQIDWLENHIDRYGSVVAKQPDIWGQARLTKHRQEYEDLLRQKLDDFELLLNGQLTRSDQSYLASALALSAAVSGGRRASVRRAPTEEDAIPPQPVDMSVVNTLLPSITPGVVDYQPDAKGNVTPKIDATKVTNQTNIFRTPPGSRVPGFGAQFAASAQIGLEPTIVLDQLSRYLSHLDELRRINEGDDTADSPGYSLNLVRIPISISPGQVTRKGYGAEITVSCTPRLSATLLPTTFRSLVINDVVDQLALPVTQLADSQAWNDNDSGARDDASRLPAGVYGDASPTTAEGFAARSEELTPFRQSYTATQGPSARSRQAQNPVPPSQVVAVFGEKELTTIAKWFFLGYRGPNVRWSDDGKEQRVHFLDVQRFIEAETSAAIEMLSRPDTEYLWQEFIETEKLVEALRTGDINLVAAIRTRFIRALKQARPSQNDCGCVDALAWAIIVEAALLNDQLISDMQEVAEAKGCGCAPAENLQYYLPHPAPEACESFNEYVLCRWPIHVFALDPVTQDQNIGDTYSRAQELQLALSLSFVSGRMNANSMTRYARRLETEMQTVALNRTAVGFSHGDDTFGWRFYPRFQSPPFKGTIANFGETLLGPSRDGDLLERQIEPGMRECVAIVIMPSFVPYVTFDTRTNWFRLNHCNGWLPTRHHVETSMVHALKLSRSIRGMERSALMASCPELYRDGELDRLMRRVHQLDRELPLQTMLAQVPIENTLGGFEMFSHGVTDLAPELYGWYGCPGIVLQEFEGYCKCKEQSNPPQQGAGGQQNSEGDANNHGLVYRLPDPCPCTEGTTLFLVGDHFSVHDTKVIAGHRCIPDVTLLSRQVMRVTIPGDVATVKVGGDGDRKKAQRYVDVHLATPYGVTAHLHVPVVEKSTPASLEKAVEKVAKDTAEKAAKEAVNSATADLKNVVSTLRYQVSLPGDASTLELQYGYFADQQELALKTTLPRESTIEITAVDQTIHEHWKVPGNYQLAVAIQSGDELSLATDLNLPVRELPLLIPVQALAEAIVPLALHSPKLLPDFAKCKSRIEFKVRFYLQSRTQPDAPLLPLRTQNDLPIVAIPGCAEGGELESAPEVTSQGPAVLPEPEITEPSSEATEPETVAPVPVEIPQIQPEPRESAHTGRLRLDVASPGVRFLPSKTVPAPARSATVLQAAANEPRTRPNQRPTSPRRSAEPRPWQRAEPAPKLRTPPLQPVGDRPAPPYNRASYR